jgi:hypothetical protein
MVSVYPKPLQLGNSYSLTSLPLSLAVHPLSTNHRSCNHSVWYLFWRVRRAHQLTGHTNG